MIVTFEGEDALPVPLATAEQLVTIGQILGGRIMSIKERTRRWEIVQHVVPDGFADPAVLLWWWPADTSKYPLRIHIFPDGRIAMVEDAYWLTDEEREA